MKRSTVFAIGSGVALSFVGGPTADAASVPRYSGTITLEHFSYCPGAAVTSALSRPARKHGA